MSNVNTCHSNPALDNLPDAYAYHRMIFDSKGNYADYVFLDINKAFERMTGLLKDDVIGQKVTKVVPGISDSEFDWIGTYGRVSETGETIRFEQYFEPLKAWYSVTAYSFEQGFFVSVFRDITKEKQAEETLKKREQSMRLKLDSILSPEGDISSLSLSDIVDIEQIQSLMNKFYNLTNIGMALVDLKGNLLVYTGWQDICTKFHRIHPITEKHCKESDTQLSSGLKPGSFKLYKCKNNLWDIATPVMVGGEHMGNLFLGQFFFDDDKIDLEVFRNQAHKYGFNEKEYIAALEKVPRRNRETINIAMTFFTELANMISLLSYSNFKLAGLLSERDFIISEREKAEEKISLYALELENTCLKLDQEISKAYTIHKRTLPSEMPEIEGISMAAHYQPATLIGGDSYNVTKSGNKLVVYLSDVMGHGLDSAMLSVFVKETINIYITLKPEELNPKDILHFIGLQYQREKFPDEYLISIFMTVLNLDTMELTYASAGFQTPPLVTLGNGENERLNCSGLLISNSLPFETVSYQEYMIKLTPGSTVFFTTDGLVEQESGKEWFYARYEDVFYGCSHLPPEIIVQIINNDFFRFNNNSLTGEDDITFLALQVNADKQEKHVLEIKSNIDQLDILYKKLKSISAGSRDSGNLLTCLHELVANAMEHGNRFDPDKTVKIELTIIPEYVIAEVEDEGDGFNWWEKIDEPLNLEGLSERGRGIPMIKILSGNLYYNPEGNRATLFLKVS